MFQVFQKGAWQGPGVERGPQTTTLVSVKLLDERQEHECDTGTLDAIWEQAYSMLYSPFLDSELFGIPLFRVGSDGSALSVE